MHGISSKGYETIIHEVHEAYEKVETNTMSKVASEVHAYGKETVNEDPSIVLCECSVDGTWQKQGHRSYNGVVTAISSGTFIERHVMSKYCRAVRGGRQSKAPLDLRTGKLSIDALSIIQNLQVLWRLLEQLLCSVVLEVIRRVLMSLFGSMIS